MKHLIAVLTGALGIALSAAATPVSYTGGSYSQNFNGLAGSFPLSYPSGWEGFRYAGIGTVGQPLSLMVTNFSLDGRMNFARNPALNPSDLALGAAADPFTSPVFGVQLINQSSTAFGSISLGGVGEEWNNGRSSAVVDRLVFEYSFNASSVVDFSATWIALSSMDVVEVNNPDGFPTQLDGNLPANRSSLFGTIAAAWSPGTTLSLRWRNNDDPDFDAFLAVDDFRLEATPVPEATPIAASAVLASLVGWQIRRIRSRRIALN